MRKGRKVSPVIMNRLIKVITDEPELTNVNIGKRFNMSDAMVSRLRKKIRKEKEGKKNVC